LISGNLSLEEETGIDLSRVYAEQLGVAPADILRESESMSTFENAQFSYDFMKANGFTNALVVTSPFHSRRTRKIFRDIFLPEIKFTVCCYKQDDNLRDWWKRSHTAREILYEYSAYFWYVIFRN